MYNQILCLKKLPFASTHLLQCRLSNQHGLGQETRCNFAHALSEMGMGLDYKDVIRIFVQILCALLHLHTKVFTQVSKYLHGT